MDPEETIKQLLQALREDDFEEAYSLIAAYREWRKKSGYKPQILCEDHFLTIATENGERTWRIEHSLSCRLAGLIDKGCSYERKFLEHERVIAPYPTGRYRLWYDEDDDFRINLIMHQGGILR